MNEKQLEFSLKSLEADAAMEALERRERGEAASPDSPLGDKDVAAIKALAVDLDEEFYERKAAQLIGALQKPDGREIASLDDARAARAARNAVARDAGAAQALRSRRLKRVVMAAVPLLLAAGFLLWLVPMGALDAEIQAPQVSYSSYRGSPSPTGAPVPAAERVPITTAGCINVVIPLQISSRQSSEEVAAQAYLVSGKQSVPWNLGLQPDPQGALHSPSGCQPLPAGVSAGPWELVVLVGSPGRLWWYGKKLLHSAQSGAAQGHENGLHFVRRSLQLVNDPAELAK